MSTPLFLLIPGPPTIPTDAVQVRQVHRAGSNLRLMCPAIGDPEPLLGWEKDGEAINAGWERFRVAQSSLRIKAVAEDDSGKYVCKATNGFGSATLEYWLFIYREYCVTLEGQRLRDKIQCYQSKTSHPCARGSIHWVFLPLKRCHLCYINVFLDLLRGTKGLFRSALTSLNYDTRTTDGGCAIYIPHSYSVVLVYKSMRYDHGSCVIG